MKKILLGILLGFLLSDLGDFYFIEFYKGQEPLSIDFKIANFISSPFINLLYEISF